MNERIQIVKDLSDIFPDIQGELCSRHSILFGKLKNTYNKTYDHMEPENYIVIKGVLEIFNDNNVTLSMGLENGVILMSRGIDKRASIFINSNHFDEELIMTCDGKLQEGLNSYADEIGIAIKAATEGIPSQNLHGGIFYVHCNIPEDFFHYKEILLLSIFLAVSKINDNLSFKICELIKKLSKYQIFGSKQLLTRLFSFRNRQFTLTVGQQTYTVPLEKENKMIICQLDLAKVDINFERNKKKQLKSRKTQILRLCQEKYGISSILQLFQGDDDLLSKLHLQNQMTSQEEEFTAQQFIQTSVKELGLLVEFNNKNITFEQLVSAQWTLNSEYWQVHTQEVVQLVEQVKQTLKLNSCMILSEKFALIIADKNKYTDLLIFLRQKIHKGQLKSKSLFKIEEELIQQRWNSNKQIGQQMFTSVPSCGVSIFDPSEAIWFD